MGIVEILFIIAAIVSVAGMAFVFIKFKNLKFSLIAGLVAIAFMLSLILFVSGGSDAENNDDILQTTVTSTSALHTEVVTTTSAAETEIPKITEAVSAETYKPTATVAPTIAPTTVPPTVPPTTAPVETVTPTKEPPRTATPEVTANPELGKNSVIYLTFDDGPSPRTTEVLDVLKKYNVKATFFILNFEDYQIPILQRVIDEGHAIGIHGYSHEYADIYKSEAAFMENVTKLRNRIKDTFGYDTNIMRFPGGSSNTISSNYCVGIMSTLVNSVENQGYSYYDWNVDSRDAEGFNSAQIISQVKSTIYSKRAANVVLMHDNGDKYETVKSLPAIIEWAVANGYSFGKLSASTAVVHHSVRN